MLNIKIYVGIIKLLIQKVLGMEVDNLDYRLESCREHFKNINEFFSCYSSDKVRAWALVAKDLIMRPFKSSFSQLPQEEPHRGWNPEGGFAPAMTFP